MNLFPNQMNIAGLTFMKHFKSPMGKTLFKPDMTVCQTDYPLDWYQKEFLPYAEEYQALPDRDELTILMWMQPYIESALKYFGNDLLLLAHYYMGGEIVKMIKYFGGTI